MINPVLGGSRIIVEVLDEPPEHDELLKDTYDAIEATVEDKIELPTDHGVGEEADDTLLIDGTVHVRTPSGVAELLD
ncbi:hypothetical protein halTADL_2647 [Halohasta litchfieldiae]|jgi:hypothetical protein|uniref:Uncharacterized protein n=1 Tax=Halohasta litchfieldiae TaxID=1073996 RepID=A0A1H6VVK2_9EURY|nr:hypothetical protein [Halohasta litchfieldiae]ATW89372.1 hypothetical protein halTADL_2647 [Halohasta litchfieldiae]SEJ05847.1 hypothetical protein SAMN05444271_11860 [Halohasta litchfieldiae]